MASRRVLSGLECLKAWLVFRYEISDLLAVNFSDSPIGIPCKSICCLLAGEGIILATVVQHSDVGVGRDKQAIMDSEHEPTVALCREGRKGR